MTIPPSRLLFARWGLQQAMLARATEASMLVLTRRKNEALVIGEIRVVVVEIRGDKVRLGIDAPKDMPVHRREVYEALQRDEAASSWSNPQRVADPAPNVVTLSPRNVAVLDRLRERLADASGTAPRRQEMVEAILDAVSQAEGELSAAPSLDALKARLAERFKDAEAP